MGRQSGIARINPLADRTRQDVWRRIIEHDVPYNPLHDLGYPSTGRGPCTSAVPPDEVDRAGRWRGSARTECGLHGRSQMYLYPAFLKLRGRQVVVVGAGPVAASKLRGLLDAGANVTVVAPKWVDEAAAADVTRVEREFRPSDLDGAWLVVAAATPAVNREVAQAAEARCVFVNAVDDPSNASLYLGGVLHRSGVTVAVSTDGQAPALAGLLREALDALLPPDELERWLSEAARLRRRWRAEQVPMAARRPELLEALVKLYTRDGSQADRGAETATRGA